MELIAPSNERRQPRSILDLPPEVRVRIYQMVVHGSSLRPLPCYKMSSTCKMIRHEALPIILGETKFWKCGLEKFLRWAEAGVPRVIELVRHVSIYLPDHRCLLKIAQSPQLQHIPPSENLTESSLNALDLDSTSGVITSIWSALCSLRNLGSLTLVTENCQNPLSEDPSQRFQTERQLFLDLASFACPDILYLEFTSDLHSLSNLNRFSKLRHLCFSGFSSTLPEETLSILCSLKYLDSLTIRQCQDDRPAGVGLEHFSKTVHLSITPTVLAQMNPLKFYRVEVSSRCRTIHPSIEMLKSLRAHSRFLENFEFELDAHLLPEKEFLLEILDFVSTCPVRSFYLKFILQESFTTMNFKSFFPPTGKAVDIFVSSDRDTIPRAWLEVRAGKHLPDPKMIAFREEYYDWQSGHSMPFMSWDADLLETVIMTEEDRREEEMLDRIAQTLASWRL